jgi:hypothetical protein
MSPSASSKFSRSSLRFVRHDLFCIKIDDFSVQIVSPVDPLFWIRIERGGGEDIRVSDVKFASISSSDAAAALDLAIVVELSDSVPKLLTFLDVEPQVVPRREEGYTDVVSSVTARLLDLVRQYSSQRGMHIGLPAFTHRRGKIDMTVPFRSACCSPTGV